MQHWSFFYRHRERDDAAAVRTGSKVGERLLVLVGRQNVLDEGAELVRVWMMPGLEEVAHSGSDAVVGAEAVLSENDEI